MRGLRTFSRFIGCGVVVAWLAGCAGLVGELPAKAPRLTTPQEKILGEACLPVAIQRLGGRYVSPVLNSYIERLGKMMARQIGRSDLVYQFVIVDRNDAGLYTLPAGKILISRGLLQQLGIETEYAALLEQAILRSHNSPFGGAATRSMVELSRQVLEKPKPQEIIELDLPADRLAQAIITRDGPSAVDFGALQSTVRSSFEVLAFQAKERQAVEELQAMQAGYQRLDQAKRLEASGEQRAAIAAYLQAAVEAPGQAAILSALGMAYLRADDLNSARVHLQEAARLQPEYYRTRMGLGYLRLQAGDWEEALAQLQVSAQLLPVPENYFLIGQAYEKIGQPEAAMRYYQAIIATDPRSKLGHSAGERLGELKRTL